MTEVVAEVLAAGSLNARLTCRVKDVASYRAKVIEKQYADPWADVTDKIGARALVERAGHVDAIHLLLVADGRMEILQVSDKRSHTLEEMGYSGLHLDLLAPSEPGDTEPIICELQIRTVAQDAWSVVSHKLLYKPSTVLEPADRRAIMRLVSLVEVFDEEVERVMSKLPLAVSVPGDESVDLTGLVSAHYALFEHNDSNSELTQIVLETVYEALQIDPVDDYPRVLGEYVKAERVALSDLYTSYGPRSEMATAADYVLWSQPESIALLEALERRPHALYAAWQAKTLPDAWLAPLALHTSADLDL